MNNINKDWRTQQRERLLAVRRHAGEAQRHDWNQVIEDELRTLLPDASDTVFGMYWPFKTEFAVRPLMRELHSRGGRPALPRVVARGAPLAFCRWHPGVTMGRDIEGIPCPVDTPDVLPEVLLVPVLGFDGAGYRLGYGGGYYDRTIAAMTQRPLLIGVGYEMSRLESVHAQAHDIPMDYIVTEAGVHRSRQ